MGFPRIMRLGTLVILALIATPRSSIAETCVEAIDVTGASATVVHVRTLLATSELAAQSAKGCRGVRLTVNVDRGRWRFLLERGERQVRHETGTPTEMVAWIESWLAIPGRPSKPPQSVLRSDGVGNHGPSTPSPPKPPSPPEPKDREGSTRRKETPSEGTSQLSVPLIVSARGSVDIAEVGPVWPGIEVGIRAHLTPSVWMGVAGAGAWSIVSDDTRRRALRVSGRVGWTGARPWGRLAVGAGAGIVSADASQRTVDSGTISDDESGPFIELCSAIDFFVAGPISISVGVGFRTYFVDDFDEGGASGEVEPVPIRGVSAGMQLGLSWSFGVANER